ncbi:TPA: helix-turn-helix domain-containing protein, partial [Streptococcus pneumoniae]
MNRLKELRQEKKLSQKEIAETLGFSLRSFQRMENGESQIKPEKAQLLADYFGVSVANLLGYENNFIESVKNLSQKDGSDEV